MNKFNIFEFEKNQINDEYVFKTNDGRVITQRQFSESKEYIEESVNPNSYYSKTKVFYMESGNIKIEGEMFYKMTINTWSYYANNGTLTKQINWESKFKFSLNDLIEFIKIKYNIDMMRKDNQVYAERSIERDPRPYYLITFPVGPDRPGYVNTVVIDGINGKEIEKHVSAMKH